ncbi:MAG: flavin reductase [Hungatella sp.]
MPQPAAVGVPDDTKVNPNAMFKLSYGLFVLTAKDGIKDNGCITNAVMQITDSPKQIVIGVNKQNYTHDMIIKSGEFNISVLTQETPFRVFEHFGFQSGRDVNKFEGCDLESRSKNGLIYLSQYTNAVISGKVIAVQDCGTHTLFTAEVIQATVLSNVPSVNYDYYFSHIKPKPQPLAQDKKGFVCKICGYVYEGDVLPEDFICPLCKHGSEDFEPLN